MESFEGLTAIGNLTTEIINISISLVEELNTLMMSEGLSIKQSEIQVKHYKSNETLTSLMKRLYQSLCN